MHSSGDIGAACGGGSGVSIAGAARGAALGEGAPPALFRAAAAADFPLLVSFVHAQHVESSSWDAASRAAQVADLPTDFPDLVSPDAWASLSRGAWLFADPAGALVAAAGLKASPTLPAGGVDVSFLFVAPVWRGRGLGARLLGACLQAAEAVGAPAVRLLSITVYEAALKLYASRGFAEWKPRETVGLYTLVHLEKRLGGGAAAGAAERAARAGATG
jgi:GNAT superfamily N-acetyltransferase